MVRSMSPSFEIVVWQYYYLNEDFTDWKKQAIWLEENRVY